MRRTSKAASWRLWPKSADPSWSRRQGLNWTTSLVLENFRPLQLALYRVATTLCCSVIVAAMSLCAFCASASAASGSAPSLLQFCRPLLLLRAVRPVALHGCHSLAFSSRCRFCPADRCCVCCSLFSFCLPFSLLLCVLLIVFTCSVAALLTLSNPLSAMHCPNWCLQRQATAICYS
jgi:hypothetical protein